MKLTIHGVPLDDVNRVYVIAEASGNHAQDYATAEALVVAAAESGADAVKFQTFTAEEICADIPLLIGYNVAHDAWLTSQGVTRMRELFARGGVPRVWHAPLKKLAEDVGITFLSTPFSCDALRFLVEDIGVSAIKIASGDLTFTPLLQAAAQTRLPILLSTGAATYAEILKALGVINIARGYKAYAHLADVIVLHCRALYPCPDAYASLRVISHLQHYCSVAGIGWSDHSLDDTLVPALAVACGACLIEKHLRLDGDTTSVDAEHSLTPTQFRHMVDVVRRVPAILGDGRKEPVGREVHERAWMRRSPEDWRRPTQRAREGFWE